MGGKRLTNDWLVAAVGALDVGEPEAYQASGNVLLTGTSLDVRAIEDRLEAGLEEAFGYPVPTMVRAAEELHEMLEIGKPPPGKEPAGKPQVVFFKQAPDAAAIRGLEAATPDGDFLEVVGREVHWWPQSGVAGSAIDWQKIDRAHGPSTMRTRGTIERIVKKL